MKNNPKVRAAKRLVDALESDLDFAIYLDAHPNEKRGKERLLKDLGLSNLCRSGGVEEQTTESQIAE